MLMTREEIENSVKWAANEEALLTRDQQILIMTTARERHAAAVERFRQILKEKYK